MYSLVCHNFLLPQLVTFGRQQTCCVVLLWSVKCDHHVPPIEVHQCMKQAVCSTVMSARICSIFVLTLVLLYALDESIRAVQCYYVIVPRWLYGAQCTMVCTYNNTFY